MVIGVKFSDRGKIYNFNSEIDLIENQKVIVETEKGQQLGIVSKVDINNVKSTDLKNIIRVADDSDYNKYLNNLSEASETLSRARKIVEDLGLDMRIIDCTYSLDKKLLLLNFFADERIDFRDLVKELASIYHTRIELHQVGIRDKAKIKGGIGLCGRILCCSNHLQNIDSVNINMVKNQNIALNPSKINGACGRLLCCFNFENEIYSENRKELPKVKDLVEYNGNKYEVIDVDVLNKKYHIKIDDTEIKEIDVK